MDYHILLLKNILHDCNYMIDFAEYSYDDFEYSVINRFKEYHMSPFNRLVTLYPVQFMNLAFYDTYIRNKCGSLRLIDTIDIFYPFQNHNYVKYTALLSALFDKIKNYNPIDDLSNSFELLNVESKESNMCLDSNPNPNYQSSMSLD